MIEAVTTCVGYSDFLAYTLPLNKQYFDRIVVVTSPEDAKTQRLCEHLYVECVVTWEFHRDGEGFAKARGINEGLAKLSLKDWVVHLDADMAMPPLTGKILRETKLDPTMIYGCDRYIIPNYKTWSDQTREPKLEHENNVYVHANAYPLGTRIAPPGHGGYIPIGFFQLWNPSASGVKAYPTTHTGAGRTDMLFACQWDRQRRGHLPELIGYHLDSDPTADQGANWNGRTTPPFGPARYSLATLQRHWRKPRRHHHHHHHHPTPPPYTEPA